MQLYIGCFAFETVQKQLFDIVGVVQSEMW